MGKLVETLELVHGNFDRGINSAVSSVEKLNKSSRNGSSVTDMLSGKLGNMGNVTGAASGIVSKFAGAIGVVTTAQGVFDKLLENSAELSKQYSLAVAEGTNVVNTFFASLAAGDFSPFINGLEKIIMDAREAASQISVLQRMSGIGNNKIAALEYRNDKLKYTIRTSKNPKEIASAKKELASNNQEVKRNYKELGDQSGKAFTTSFNNTLHKNGYTGKDLTEKQINALYYSKKFRTKGYKDTSKHTSPSFGNYSIFGDIAANVTNKVKDIAYNSTHRPNDKGLGNALARFTNKDVENINDLKSKEIGNYSSGQGYENSTLRTLSYKGSGGSGSGKKTGGSSKVGRSGKTGTGTVKKTEYQKAVDKYNEDYSSVNLDDIEGLNIIIKDLEKINTLEKDSAKQKAHSAEIDKEKEKIQGLLVEKSKTLDGINELISNTEKDLSSTSDTTKQTEDVKNLNKYYKDRWNIQMDLAKLNSDDTEENRSNKLSLIQEGISKGYIKEIDYHDQIVELQQKENNENYQKSLNESGYLTKLDVELDHYKELVDNAKTLDDYKKKVSTYRSKTKEAANKRYDAAKSTNDGSRQGIQDTIDALENKMQFDTGDTLKKDKEELKEYKKQLDDLNNTPLENLVASFDKVENAVNSLSTTFSDLNNFLSETFGKSEVVEELSKVFSVMSDGMKVVDDLSNAYDAISKVVDMFTVSEHAATVAVEAKSVANATEAGSNAASVGVSATKTGANIAEGKSSFIAGIGNVIKAFTSMGVPGYILMFAAVAGVIALFAKAMGSFAEGGVVNSNLKHGDSNLIRVNGGEMVLTTNQQTNLFKMLNNGNGTGGYGGNVQFRISGKDLVGTLSNYNNKLSKVN